MGTSSLDAAMQMGEAARLFMRLTRRASVRFCLFLVEVLLMLLLLLLLSSILTSSTEPPSTALCSTVSPSCSRGEQD